MLPEPLIVRLKTEQQLLRMGFTKEPDGSLLPGRPFCFGITTDMLPSLGKIVALHRSNNRRFPNVIPYAYLTEIGIARYITLDCTDPVVPRRSVILPEFL